MSVRGRTKRCQPGWLLLVAAATHGCFGARAPERGAGSALWVDPRIAAPSHDELARLESSGVGDLFVEAGRLDLTPRSAILAGQHLPRLARRMPVILVLGGVWPAEKVAAAELVASLVSRMMELKVAAEGAGLLPRGWHLDLEVPPERLEELGAVLKPLRRSLDPTLWVSLQVPREWLDREKTRAAVREVDFVASFLYGQRPEESEDPRAWDLHEVERNVAALERLGRPFLLGVALTGNAFRLGPRGGVMARTLDVELQQLAQDSRLELKPGFSLEGVDRQVYEFVARRPVAVGPWQMAPGESVRLVRTATPLLEELLRRAGAWDASHRLGELYYRYAAPHERMALGVSQLLAALDPEPAAPKPVVELERLSRSDRSWRVRVRLRNLSEEPSDLSIFDHNFVELRLEGALVGHVDPGSFRRFDLAFQGKEVRTLRALRHPDTLLLFVPLLQGRAVHESGPIELRLQRPNPRIVTGGEFLTAEGRLASVEPQEWIFEEKR